VRKNLCFFEKVEFEAEEISSKPGLYCGTRRFSAGGAPPLVQSRVASTSGLAVTNADSFLGLGARLLLSVSGCHCLHTALRLLLGRARRLCGAIRGAFTHCAVRLSRAVALKVFKAMRYAGQARNPTLPLAMLAGLWMHQLEFIAPSVPLSCVRDIPYMPCAMALTEALAHGPAS
jgi:hypothetical protein